MYIISKQKDYYDGVVGTVGIDKTIVYERSKQGIENYKDFPKEFKAVKWHRHENPFTSIVYFDTDSKKYDESSLFIIGFCGKLYLGWKFFYKVREYDPEFARYGDNTKVDIVYGYDEAKKHLKEGYWRGNLEDQIKYVLNYDPINIFRELNAPIFVFDSHKNFRYHYQEHTDSQFIINPNLKEYDFPKVMDAFTAFQEIQMFISGVLGVGERDIIEVEDKYKIAQHGFDKWSFRKEPEKKR